jgi:hypothetical protein
MHLRMLSRVGQMEKIVLTTRQIDISRTNHVLRTVAYDQFRQGSRGAGMQGSKH